MGSLTANVVLIESLRLSAIHYLPPRFPYDGHDEDDDDDDSQTTFDKVFWPRAKCTLNSVCV
jgi:hypothetical protein